jgi:hypothetical protein
MTRRSALILGGLVLVAFGVVGVNFGLVEPLVPATAVPVPQPVAFVGAIGFTLVAALINSLINARVWRRMGSDLGLTPASRFAIFAKSDLTGEVEGRPIRVYTYTEGGGHNDSGTTYTAVETELTTPVDWGALVGPAEGGVTELGPSDIGVGSQEGSLANMPEAGGARTVAVQDGLAVWGDLPAEYGDQLLTPRVQRALAAVEGGAGVGDASGMAADAMGAMLEDAEGFGAGLAKGMLDAADEGGRPTATVIHEQKGLVLDSETVGRRIEAVVATAAATDDAIDTN